MKTAVFTDVKVTTKKSKRALSLSYFCKISYLCHKFKVKMATIRKATLKDCNLIHDLAWEIFPVTYREILTPDQTRFMMEWMYSPDNIAIQIQKQGHVYFILYETDKPCGYVSVQQEEEDLFHLQKIYVLPSHQGEGYGELLFHHAVNYIKEIHPAPCAMELNVNRNNPAVNFYKRMGMSVDRKGDFPIGEGFYMNDYIMRIVI